MQFGIVEAVDHWAKYRPHSIAVRANGAPTTYRELNALAAAMAANVENVASNEKRVAVAFGSKIRMLAGILGVLRTGRSVVLVNTGLPLDAIRVNLQDAAVQVMLHDESKSHLANLVCSSIATPSSMVPELLAVPITKRGPSDEWGVIYSSGTTGVPKGIERDHESIVTELVGWCLELGLTRHSQFYIGRPIYYTGGLVLALSPLLVAGTIILNDFQHDELEEEVWRDYQRTLESFSIEFAFFVPEQLRKFLHIAAAQHSRTARTIITMGAPITGSEKLHVKRDFGCDIIESWGNSESLGTITDPEDVHIRSDSIGRPFVTDEMFVVDENCQPVTPRLLGRLAGSENAGFLRYCNRPEETILVKKNELIISEDVGYQDEEGYFYIRGRSQNSIVLLDGSTVFLEDLDKGLRELPMIRECSVIPKRGDDGKPTVFVALVLVEGQEASGWENAVRQQLGSQITLEQIRLLNELPRLPSFKINRLAIEQGFDDSI